MSALVFTELLLLYDGVKHKHQHSSLELYMAPLRSLTTVRKLKQKLFGYITNRCPKAALF